MKHKRLIVTAMLLVAAALSYAQEEIPHSIVPNIIPPLPQSMIFDKYLNHEIEEYNGLTEITIPLYTIEIKGMSIPVYLSYHASGIKFRQYDGEVGAGWMLNVGGFRVTRRIFGKADEKFPMYDENTFEQSGRYGFYEANAYLGNILFDDYLEDYQTDIMNDISFPDGRQDSGRDLFNFHLPTASGHFVMSDRNTETFEVVGKTPERIETTWGDGYMIIDGHGNRFEMSGDINLTERSDMKNVTAWPMVRVVTSLDDTMSVSYVRQLKNQQRGFTSNNLIITEAATMFEGSDSFEDHAQFSVDGPSDEGMYWESLVDAIHTKDQCLSVIRNGAQPNIITELQIRSKVDDKLIKRITFSYDIPATYHDGHYLLKTVTIYEGTAYHGECYQMSYNGGPTNPCPDTWGYYTSSPKIGNMDHAFQDDTFLHDSHLAFKISRNSYNNLKTPLSEWNMMGYRLWANRQDTSNVADWYSLTSITYPTGGTTSYEYEPHEFRLPEGALIKGGGVRVSKISSYGEDIPNTVTTYSYGEGKPNIEISTAAFRDEKLFYTIERENICLEDISRCNRQITFLTECKISEASDFKVQYDYVKRHTVTDGNPGHSESTTISYYKIPESYVMSPVERHCFPKNDDIKYSQYNVQVKTYYPERNPMLTKREYYNDIEDVPIKTEYFTYEVTDSSVFNGVKIYQQAFFNTYFEVADSYIYNAPECVYSYFDYLKYSIITGSYRLKEKKVVGEMMEIQETYTYNSDNQLIKVSSRLSENPVQNRNREFVYSRTVPDLLERNIVSDLVQMTVSHNDVILEKVTKEYGLYQSGKFVLPSSTKVFKNGSTDPNTLETYNWYDKYGNLVSVTGDDGVETVFVWSYSGRYPILEIKNASVSQVESVICSVFGVGSLDAMSSSVYDSGDKEELINRFRTVREHPLLSEAMVTGYTYDPLLGISSVTDSSGRTMYYEYKDNMLSCIYYMSAGRKCIVESYNYKYANY